jgi:hypothetical protein
VARLMSVALTREQVRDQSKTVTRRQGWLMLKPGDTVTLCEQVQGLKKGEHPVRITDIEIVSVRRERLDAFTPEDVAAEGFPGWSVKEFIRFFVGSHKGCEPGSLVTRIQWVYPPGEDSPGTAKTPGIATVAAGHLGAPGLAPSGVRLTAAAGTSGCAAAPAAGLRQGERRAGAPGEQGGGCRALGERPARGRRRPGRPRVRPAGAVPARAADDLRAGACPAPQPEHRPGTVPAPGVPGRPGPRRCLRALSIQIELEFAADLSSGTS